MSNFYSNKLYAKRYLKILINFKKDFSKRFLIQNNQYIILQKNINLKLLESGGLVRI